MMKILFINPPNEFETPVPPLGLASLVAYLRSKDESLNIQALDAWGEKVNLQELGNKVQQSKADIVGIYMASARYDATKETIEVCRKALPNSLIIAGGPHPSAMPQETLKDIPQLDICAVGEGEITMHELVKGYPLSDIDGIAYRRGKEIIVNKPREFIKNLDDLPFPDRDLFPIKRYKVQPPLGRKNPCFTMVTSRGCPYQCTFCSKDVFKSVYRARSPKNMCDEIEYLVNKYGAKEIDFYDDNFTFDMKRTEEFCDEIMRRGIKIIWFCATRVDQVNENLLRKMKAAGCWHIGYGAESGNQNILNAIQKGFTVEQVISSFEITRRLGIITSAFFLYGAPGETKETLRQTFDLLKKIKPNFLCCSGLRIYPGSHIAKLIQAGEYNHRLRTLKKNESLVAAFFDKGNYTVLEDNLTFKEMKKIVQKAHWELYLRPQYIWQAIKSIRSFSDLRFYLWGGSEVIKIVLK